MTTNINLTTEDTRFEPASLSLGGIVDFIQNAFEVDDELVERTGFHPQLARHRRFVQAAWSQKESTQRRIQTLADRLRKNLHPATAQAAGRQAQDYDAYMRARDEQVADEAIFEALSKEFEDTWGEEFKPWQPEETSSVSSRAVAAALLQGGLMTLAEAESHGFSKEVDDVSKVPNELIAPADSR